MEKSSSSSSIESRRFHTPIASPRGKGEKTPKAFDGTLRSVDPRVPSTGRPPGEVAMSLLAKARNVQVVAPKVPPLRLPSNIGNGNRPDTPPTRSTRSKASPLDRSSQVNEVDDHLVELDEEQPIGAQEAMETEIDDLLRRGCIDGKWAKLARRLKLHLEAWHMTPQDVGKLCEDVRKAKHRKVAFLTKILDHFFFTNGKKVSQELLDGAVVALNHFDVPPMPVSIEQLLTVLLQEAWDAGTLDGLPKGATS